MSSAMTQATESSQNAEAVQVRFCFVRDTVIHDGLLLAMGSEEILFGSRFPLRSGQYVNIDICSGDDESEDFEFGQTVQVVNCVSAGKAYKIRAAFAPVTETETTNRRSAPRHRLRLEGTFTIERNQLSRPCRLIDISVRGVGFEYSSSIRLREGEALLLSLEKKEGEAAMSIKAVVANTRHVGEGIYRVGCMIEEVL